MDLNVTVPTGFTTREIEESGTTTYVGYSEIGEPSDGQWFILKVEEGATTTMEYAEGAWDDRATLTYE